jgi:hypothetical protein
MGISIHFKGNLREATSLKNLIKEVKDIAQQEQWKHFVFEENFPDHSFQIESDNENLYGIMLSPPESEPICISFAANGKMCGILNFNAFQMSNHVDDTLLYTVSAKTQYAGIEIHKKIIIFLDYINKTYLSNFECIDEGMYWESRDEKLLKETFDKYTQIISDFSDGLTLYPKLLDETTEEYCTRIAFKVQSKTKSGDDNTIDAHSLPELSLEQENEFKKLNLMIEHDAEFFEGTSNLPPEIEGHFLDHVSNFEEAFKNSKKTTIYNKIGKPNYKSIENLTDAEVTQELEILIQLLERHQIGLDVICDYENEDRLIYNFITSELLQLEIEDMNIPGMITHFTYEEFHPNHNYDLERYTMDFLTIFLDKKSNTYKKHHSTDALNHEILNKFRSLFRKFKIKKTDITSINHDDLEATVLFNIHFWGRLKQSETKVNFSGKGKMTFDYKYGYWYVKIADLPITDTPSLE